MQKLNYFKPFTELTEDFKQLSLVERANEIQILNNSYSRLASDDLKFIGSLTSQTKQLGSLIDLLNQINLQCFEMNSLHL